MRPSDVIAARSSGVVGRDRAMAWRSRSLHSSAGRMPAPVAASARQARSASSAWSRAAGSLRSSGGGGTSSTSAGVDAGDQRARLAPVAAAPGGPRDDEAVGGPGDGDVQQPRLLGPRRVRRGRAVRDEARLDAGHDDDGPLPALGGVERQHLDAGGGVARRRTGGPWRSTSAAPAPSPNGWSRRNSRTAAATRRSAIARSSSGVASSGSIASWAHARSRLADVWVLAARVATASGEPGVSWSRCTGMRAASSACTSRGSCPFVRASTATWPARTSCGSSERTNAATSAASWSSSSAADHPHRRRRPTRADVAGRVLAVGAEHLDAGGDDLRRAAVVHRQVDDLDPREAGGDVEQQVGIGAVEAVDRLRRIADEEEVAAPTVEQRRRGAAGPG